MPLIQPYITYGDISAQWNAQVTNQFPDAISRMEAATGLLVRGVLVNGHYLLCDSCDLFPKQDMEMETFIQGGPKRSIANIGKRWVDGRITCPVRVDKDYILDEAIKQILENAQYPNKTIKIDTNHSLAHLKLTSKYPGTSDNQLVTFDTLIVQDLKLKATPTEGVKLEVSFTGMIEERRASYLVSPPDGFILGRALGWGDCTASRFESSMRTVSSLQIYIKNKPSLHVFLNPINTPVENRSDNTQIIGVENVDWGGLYTEVLRKGVDNHTYVHGGWMVNENLVMEFGPIFVRILVPLFKPAEQPLSSKMFVRTTYFWSQSRPNISSSQDLLFFFGGLPSSDSAYPPLYSNSSDIVTTLAA